MLGAVIMEAVETKKSVRITADLAPEAYDTLTSVALNMQTTKAEALRKALGLLSFILKYRRDGWNVVLEKDGARKEIITL